MELPLTGDIHSFGVKLFDATCKASIPPEQAAIDALAEIWSIGVLLKPNSGKTIFIPYTETKVDASNYRVSLAVNNGLVVTLSRLGVKYDHFADKLTASWGDALARALLMEESIMAYEVPCFFAWEQPSSQISIPCRARVYETALVILPSNAPPIRLPFSYINSVNLEAFKVKLSVDGQGTIEFSRLGNATQLFADKLREAMKKVEASSIETIKTVVPSATFEELQKLSWLMVEGRAAPRKEVERISEDIWGKLEKYIGLSSLAESYHYLTTLGETNLECVGLRKAMGSVYVWFLIPVKGSPDSGGNAVALEVTSETGHATYLFRVMPRIDFPIATHDQFMQQANAVIRDLNEAVIATGFRREPIYLTDDQLNTPEYSKYLYASTHLEPLKLLRERFFARVTHNTFDQWKADMNDALKFNTASKEDTARWSKSKLDFVESLQQQSHEIDS